MRYKMFVSDFDGTLGEGPNYIEAETVERIKEYQKNGGKFVICTGRAMKSIRDIMNYYQIEGEVICCQGGIIADAKSGKILEIGGIDTELSIKIINDLINDNETVLIHHDDCLKYNKINELTRFYEKMTTLQGVLIEDVLTFVKTEKTIIQKIMALTSPERVDQIIEKYQKKYPEVIINSGSKGLVEIINPNYTKGLATKKIADKYGIDYKSVLVIGDSTNDIAMFEKEFYKVAVGNACEELKKLSDEIAVSFEYNPVKQMLIKYCL